MFSNSTTMENRRYYFIDNIRWVVVLLVLLYHVFYNYNSLGVFGGIGGFEPNQWQDIVGTLLYPWFMTLLFVVAGASSRYALQRHTAEEFRAERRRKLLVPSTLGIVLFGWVLGAMNMANAGVVLPEGTPRWVILLILIPSGTGHLWFIQDLFIFSLLLLLVRKIVDIERIDKWIATLSKRSIAAIIVAIFAVLYLSSQTQIDNPGPSEGLLNLYRPIYYFIVFLMGYYIFSSETIHSYLASKAKLLTGLALISATAFAIRYYGADYTLPDVIQSPLCALFCWATIIAMFGGFKRWADKSSPFASYMARSSFGVYIVHMTVCTGACLLLKKTNLPVWSIYAIAITTTFCGSFMLWELLRRIPFVRWCMFGIKLKR